VKVWNGLRLSITERPLPNSSKIIVFPYPISKHTSFRISVETSPDSSRQSKRVGSGRCFLVYRSGSDEGLGKLEEPSNTNFRRFLAARKDLRYVPRQLPLAHSPISSLSITSLDQDIHGRVTPFQGYENWLPLLTSKQ